MLFVNRAIEPSVCTVWCEKKEIIIWKLYVFYVWTFLDLFLLKHYVAVYRNQVYNLSGVGQAEHEKNKCNNGSVFFSDQ